MAVGTGMNNVATKTANEIKRRQAVTRAKTRILDKFEMQQLKGICKAYGIGEPSPFEEDPISGKRKKRTLSGSDYKDYIFNNLKLSQIKEYAERNRMQVWEIMNNYNREIEAIEGKSSGSASAIAPPVMQASQPESNNVAMPKASLQPKTINDEDEFSSILNVIHTQFRPEPLRDEKELEGQIAIWLNAKYPNSVRRQVQTGFGKVDVVLFGKYALELKIAANKNALRDMIGQLRDYRKVYPKIATVIMDVRAVDHSVIEDYRKEYRADGIESVVVEGSLKQGKKGSGFTVNINR
jgi:hypothetical protein